MLKKTLEVSNKLGLHARAAAKLVDLACRYQSRITISYKDRTADAKSIMNVMVVGASKGCEVELTVEGEDEQEAMTAIEKLMNNKFGEEE